jgi:hypothetical protein
VLEDAENEFRLREGRGVVHVQDDGGVDELLAGTTLQLCDVQAGRGDPWGPVGTVAALLARLAIASIAPLGSFRPRFAVGSRLAGGRAVRARTRGACDALLDRRVVGVGHGLVDDAVDRLVRVFGGRVSASADRASCHMGGNRVLGVLARGE